MKIGTVAALFRYPVKSMLGEPLQRARVGNAGFEHDREFALRDVATGKIASAKLPHRWGRMLGLRARRVDTGTVIAFPDGRDIAVGDPLLDAALSGHLGREVQLVNQRQGGMALDRADPDTLDGDSASIESAAITLEIGQAAPDGGFVDFAPIHFMPSSSLSQMAEITRSGESDAIRFRPNLILECADLPAFAENTWAGATLKIGEAAFAIITPSPRCAVPTLAHGDLPADQTLVRNLGQVNRVEVLDMGKLACLGGYAAVTRAGEIARGDEVSLLVP
ncbi:MAG: MOSC domain-containing protein [Novosphingobium sp.]|nr:MOSC domain-containing protein [Novosphingobium sp.]